MSETRTEWHGNNPYCLVITERGGNVTLIDLDEPGWVQAHSNLMRTEGRWILARKQGSEPVFSIVVSEGEQPYYTARVFTAFLPPPEWFTQQDITVSPETVKEMATVRAYGIGKKRLDNHVDRLWVLPNGVVCGGDDVEVLGHELAKGTLARVVQRLRETNGSDRTEDASRREEGGDHQGKAGQDRGAGSGRAAGPAVRFPARPKAADRTAQQRPAPRAMARPGRARGRREVGGR